MSKVYSYFLNFILFLVLVGGVAFCAPSIKGFASTVNSYSGQITRIFYSSSYSGVPTDGHSYKCKVNTSTWSMSFVGQSGVTYSNLTGEVYLLTTSGTYLIGVAGGSSSSISIANANSTRYYDGYPLKLFGILRGVFTSSSQPSAMSSGSLGFSATVEDTTGTDPDLTSIKADTSEILSILQGLDFSSISDILADIWVYLDVSQRQQFTNILSSLISIDVEVETIEDDLTALMADIALLKQSQCFDFPVTIDGNYHLSPVFFNYISSNVLNNNVLRLGPCCFDFDTFYNCSLVVRVPESHKLLFIANRLNNGTIVYPNTFKDENGISFSISYDHTSRTSSSYELFIDLPSSLATGSFISFDVVRNDISSAITVRFAMYDYVVSANDILNYMKDQWSQTAPAVSDLDSHTSITEGFGSSVCSYQNGAFTSFSSAVDGTGIRAFDWSVFGGMTVFTAIVTGFYNLLPAEYALYITAVLIVGCVAVLLSAIGRVVKKGGDNG